MALTYFHKIAFLGSFPDVKQCPASRLPEFAFSGRSNVGKSSLINMLAGRKQLARTSQTPGKTRLINLFEMDGRWILADLPGYGWARVSKSERKHLEGLITGYLLHRENLYCAFQLIDCNIPPQESDLQAIRWMGRQGIPFALVFTKTDRLTRNKLEASLSIYKKRLLEEWESLPPLFITSVKKQTGREELLGFIARSLED